MAITFTERAAREMRDRIRKACRRRLQECPENQADYWLELIRDLDSARISTIHSFCASLLRAHAVEAGIDPRFRVLDGAQAGTLLFELTDDVLRDRLAERDEAALALVTRFGLDRLRADDRPAAGRAAGDRLAAVARRDGRGACGAVGRVLAHATPCRGCCARSAESAAARTLLDLADALSAGAIRRCASGATSCWSSFRALWRRRLACAGSAGETPAPQRRC